MTMMQNKETTGTMNTEMMDHGFLVSNKAQTVDIVM